MHELVSLVKEYQRVLAAKKAEKNLIDFRDMEQFALQILTRKENGKRKWQTARAYSCFRRRQR